MFNQFNIELLKKLIKSTNLIKQYFNEQLINYLNLNFSFSQNLFFIITSNNFFSTTFHLMTNKVKITNK